MGVRALRSRPRRTPSIVYLDEPGSLVAPATGAADRGLGRVGAFPLDSRPWRVEDGGVLFAVLASQGCERPRSDGAETRPGWPGQGPMKPRTPTAGLHSLNGPRAIPRRSTANATTASPTTTPDVAVRLRLMPCSRCTELSG